MPQMSPIMWELLSLSTFIFILLVSLTLFFFINSSLPPRGVYSKNKIVVISWMW